MRSVLSEKRFYWLSTILLVAIFIITLVQNFIRYQQHSSYSIWTSIVYLLVSVLLFVPFIVFTVRIQKWVKQDLLKWYWPLITLFALATLGVFYVTSNVILHSVGYFDHYVDQEYARYYFGREALYHLLLILAAAVFVWTQKTSRKTLVVSKGRKTVTIALDQVEWVEAEGHYLNFYTPTDTYIKRERMGSLAKQLTPQFIRIHRKYLVNRTCIQSLERHKRDEFVVLQSGQRLKIGQSFKPIQW